MFYQLPPAGNPIIGTVTAQAEVWLERFFSPYTPRYYASGTAALAAAISAAIAAVSGKKSIDRPEVILPAYGCPDLVSAVIFAGARPVLVDLAPDRPWLDLAQLASKLGPQTVAIVAVNLFGIMERLAELRSLSAQAGVVLIEDSAQAFPGGNENNIWSGDLVVLSFGRGKPVSLLGGGAVLCHQDRLADLGQHLPVSGVLPRAGGHPGLAAACRRMLYNTMISPYLYWLPQAIPLLHLGETRFHPLPAIDAMSPAALALLPANIEAYRAASTASAQHALAELLSRRPGSESGIIDLAGSCGVSNNRRLLRYPLLLDAAHRLRVLSACRRQGLGVSLMYPTTLPQIPGMEQWLSDQGRFPVAESFASRILTLPTHARVSARDIRRMGQLLAAG